MQSLGFNVDHVLGYNATGLATFYNLICKDRGFQLPMHMTPPVMALADPRITNLMLIIGPGSGKSVLLSEIYPAWLLGHDPTQTILGISAGELLMQGFMKSVMEVVEFSNIYHNLFPRVRPDKSAGWSTERGMFVTGRSIGNPDASFAAAGLGSKALTGKHARNIICDDIHDAENSSSTDQCLKVKEIYYNTILGRADPRGARYIVAGRRYNMEDIYAHLKESGDFVVLELPAERERTNKLWFDISYPDGFDCVFSELLDHSETRKEGRRRLSDPVNPQQLMHKMQ